MKESEKWNAFSEDYDNTVFSLTKYPQRRKLITAEVEPGVIVNMGTGSAPYLNQDLIADGNTVFACDFCASMLEVAKSQFVHGSLRYVLGDSCRLPFTNGSADSVVSINSILPPERFQVQLMFNEAFRVLRSRGKFIAFLPAFDCGEQFNLAQWGIETDPEQQRENDTTGWQCFHTPETIEREIKAARFLSIRRNRVYFDSAEEIADLKKLYGLDTTNNPIYEHLLIATKH